ncbi:MAG: septal ring lytic transglycosylase RlpA family protein [Pseudomonadota bacterium]|nr:septal ring lytic transglycosylase RlpA family protein [Pseudomonadota bacterium]
MTTTVFKGMMLGGLLVLLAGCASSPSQPDHSSRYSIKQDRAPATTVDVSGLENARPRYEEPRRAGNMPNYKVWGKSYSVMATNDGYVERGIASWYGEKFHGHKTSNGEIFDMYKMTAAHKSLRIPSYARVTNLDNGRSVIVRVNDRGPFHGDRIIDLSYAAAKKLGYQSRGTARVEVAAITVRPDGSMSLAGAPFNPDTPDATVARAPSSNSGSASSGGESLFVQLGAFSQRHPAEALMAKVREHHDSPVRVRSITTQSGEFHRVQVGPFRTEDDARYAQTRLESRGFGESIVLTDSH